jgi:CheY-like chemotaxis protein
MPGGGALTIETADVQVDDEYAASRADLPTGQYVAVTVSDSGTGMPPNVIDRAFEPFYTTKPNGEGSGLGLATVYGIVTQAGGNVRIYSEPGLGTTVTMLLPVTGQLPPVPEPSPAKPEGGAGTTVLVVEDESALREVTRRILVRNGYRVMVAANGQEAIDIAARSPDHIEVLLTDVVMPQMQGKEVAGRIRALQPGIRVLFMSGYTQGLLGAQGVLEPGISLIEKPFSEATLLAKIRTTLRAPA